MEAIRHPLMRRSNSLITPLTLAQHAQDAPEREHSTSQEEDQSLLHPYGNTPTTRSRKSPTSQERNLGATFGGINRALTRSIIGLHSGCPTQPTSNSRHLPLQCSALQRAPIGPAFEGSMPTNTVGVESYTGIKLEGITCLTLLQRWFASQPPDPRISCNWLSSTPCRRTTWSQSS